jgi:hypothetical protein
LFNIGLLDFNKPEGLKHAVTLGGKYGGCFGVILLSAQDFCDGKVPKTLPKKFTMTEDQKKECIVQ